MFFIWAKYKWTQFDLHGEWVVRRNSYDECELNPSQIPTTIRLSDTLS